VTPRDSTGAAPAARSHAQSLPEIVQHGFLEPPQGWLAWLTTTDHKRIGVMYLVATFGFFVLGGTEALLLRLQLGAPDNTLLDPGAYNAIMTMHGTTMVFLFVVPVWAGFANYIVPLMTDSLGKLSFWLTFIGFNATFLVQHSLGLSGMPRRVAHYPADQGWALMNLISTCGALLLALGMLATLYNVIRSLRRRLDAGNDPWRANTLEWFTTSPPAPHNFDVIPRVRSLSPMRDIRDEVRERYPRRG
jgi:heme/copper-type cytochrome/quinol oxidase subunit 1